MDVPDLRLKLAGKMGCRRSFCPQESKSTAGEQVIIPTYCVQIVTCVSEVGVLSASCHLHNVCGGHHVVLPTPRCNKRCRNDWWCRVLSIIAGTFGVVHCFCFALVLFKSNAAQTLFFRFCFCFSAYVLRLVCPCSDSIELGGSSTFRFNIFST